MNHLSYTLCKIKNDVQIQLNCTFVRLRKTYTHWQAQTHRYVLHIHVCCIYEFRERDRERGDLYRVVLIEGGMRKIKRLEDDYYYYSLSSLLSIYLSCASATATGRGGGGERGRDTGSGSGSDGCRILMQCPPTNTSLCFFFFLL